MKIYLATEEKYARKTLVSVLQKILMPLGFVTRRIISAEMESFAKRRSCSVTKECPAKVVVMIKTTRATLVRSVLNQKHTVRSEDPEREDVCRMAMFVITELYVIRAKIIACLA
jgi:hypothetical protein